MARGRLVIYKNSFILSTLSCSGTFQMLFGANFMEESEWVVGSLYMLSGIGTMLAAGKAAGKISKLPLAKITFLEALLVFFAAVLAIWGGMGLGIVIYIGCTDGLDYGIFAFLFSIIPLILASAIFQYLKFKRWIRYLKIMGVVDDLQKSDIVCRDVYRIFPHKITLRFIRKHNPGAAEQIQTSCGKEKTIGSRKSAEETPNQREDFLPMMVSLSRDIAFPEKNAGLRLRDLFVFCFSTGDIRVVRVLNLDYYFVFIGFYVNDDTKMYYLTKKQWSKLLDSKLKEEDFPSDTAGWESLRTIEQRYSAKDIDDLIEAAVQQGMTLQDMCRDYSDCLMNYVTVQDIRIVRRIDREQYFAVLPVSEKDMYSVDLRYLNQDEVKKIAENKMTRYELLGEQSDWVSLQKCSRKIEKKEIRTFAADAENAGLTLREYLEKKTFPTWFGRMAILYNTKQTSDLLKELKSHSKEVTAAKTRKIIVVAILVMQAPAIICMFPAMAGEKSFILPLLFSGLICISVPLLIYYSVEQIAFKRILKNLQAGGMTDELENSYEACEGLYWEYPRGIMLRYIKKRNPRAAEKISASLKKK